MTVHLSPSDYGMEKINIPEEVCYYEPQGNGWYYTTCGGLLRKKEGQKNCAKCNKPIWNEKNNKEPIKEKVSDDKYRVASYFDDYFEGYVTPELSLEEAKIKCREYEDASNSRVYVSYEVRKITKPKEV